MTTNSNAQSPISFKTSVQRLPRKGTVVSIIADEKQRVALSVEHALLSVDRLSAELLVAPWKSDGVRVSGHVEADIQQACVATLEPIAASIREPVDAIFIPQGSPLAKRVADPSGEFLLDPEGPDAPELFIGDMIDVGAVAEEFFALAIDPYPRSRAELASAATPDDTEVAKPVSPFAILRNLKPDS